MNARMARETADRRLRSASMRPVQKEALRPKKVFLCAALFFTLGSGFLASAPRQDVRVIQVEAVIDRDCLGGDLKEFAVVRWLRAASRVFQKPFGVRFNLKRFTYWTPSSARLPLPRLMGEFLNRIGPEDAEIVVGLVSPDRTDSRSAGVASYADGALLLKDLESDRLMTLVLVHELCHLFGAVDLNSIGSVMSAAETRLIFDPFTTRVVSIHKSRAFGAATGSLPDGEFREALMAYRERAALDLGEVELNLLLARFCLEWGDRIVPSSEGAGGDPDCPAVAGVQEAVRQCEKAVAGRPAWAAAHHLLGIALSRGGDLDRARASFKKAMDLDTGPASRRYGDRASGPTVHRR